MGDPLGTTLAAIPNTRWAANSVVKQYTDPFGAARGTAASIPGDRQFLDKTRDTATGLTMVGARYYDEANGRFISVDPVLDLADPQQWNAYAYANNNPTTLSDPSGLTPRIDDDYDGGRGPLAKRPPATSSPAPAAQRRSYPEPSPSPGPPPHPCPCSGSSSAPTAAEKGHVAVDVVGLVSEPADGANAIWYAAEGDWASAGLSGLSLIPVGGRLLTASSGGGTARRQPTLRRRPRRSQLTFVRRSRLVRSSLVRSGAGMPRTTGLTPTATRPAPGSRVAYRTCIAILTRCAVDRGILEGMAVMTTSSSAKVAISSSSAKGASLLPCSRTKETPGLSTRR
ncbi:RHS repeat-associated core domain-containing protein [Cellulomonas sp.]|uniref:RHS repeat-associated core domain-containing protein n=2 Tax=unclassified Cellulomonas TaxID=2620175 RepID=UPI00338E9C20